jgi:hypothetical protein
MIVALIIGMSVLTMVFYNYTVDLYYEVKWKCNPKLRTLTTNFWKNSIGNFLIAGASLACIVNTLQFIFK